MGGAQLCGSGVARVSQQPHSSTIAYAAALLFEEAARRPVAMFTAGKLDQLFAAQSLAMAGLPEGEVLKAAQEARKLGVDEPTQQRRGGGAQQGWVDECGCGVTALPNRTPRRITGECKTFVSP
jgi:hypothetical protein